MAYIDRSKPCKPRLFEVLTHFSKCEVWDLLTGEAVCKPGGLWSQLPGWSWGEAGESEQRLAAFCTQWVLSTKLVTAWANFPPRKEAWHPRHLLWTWWSLSRARLLWTALWLPSPTPSQLGCQLTVGHGFSRSRSFCPSGAECFHFQGHLLYTASAKAQILTDVRISQEGLVTSSALEERINKICLHFLLAN